MKEMYLKVDVEDNDYNDFRDVYYRNGVRFMCHKDDEKLVEIEGAENKGAEKLLYAINRIAFFINNNGKDKVEELFGHANIEMILREFAPHRIIELAKELEYHVPAQGDVYKSKHTNNKVVVLSYNKETGETRYVAHNYASCEKEDYVNEHYCFTGKNIDVAELVDTLGLKGDNT